LFKVSLQLISDMLEVHSNLFCVEIVAIKKSNTQIGVKTILLHHKWSFQMPLVWQNYY